MSAFWSGRELRIADERGLAFLDAEVKRIQAAMTARTIAATANAEAREASPKRVSIISGQLHIKGFEMQ
ncbi:MAG TPA: hypothetical protein VIX91_26085 [Candidatus Acidoferrum sp.]